jgi:ubiquinone/menaquinone biosynthesis C-methylase UbiE
MAAWKAITAILTGPAGAAVADGAAGTGNVCAAALKTRPEASVTTKKSELFI